MALDISMTFTVVEQAITEPIPGYLIILQRPDGFPLYKFTGQDRNAAVFGINQQAPLLGLTVTGS